MGTPIVPVPYTFFFEPAAIVQDERAALVVTQEHNAALANVLFVPMRLAHRVAVDRHTKKIARGEQIWQHGADVINNGATRMVLALLLLIDPALRILLPRLGSVKCANMGLGNACPMGLLALMMAFKHVQQHCVRVDQLRGTGRASIGTLGTR